MLKSKIQEAKSREAMLIARSQMADTTKALAQSIGGIDTKSSFDKLSRMEEKIERKEAEAAAFSEILGAGKPEETATFEELERNARVDTELERLMAEMGMLPAEAPADPELAELAALAGMSDSVPAAPGEPGEAGTPAT